MIIKQDKFRAMCINNKYEDFGSHTGFNWRTRTHDLVIGDCYDFIIDNGGVRLIDKDDYGSYSDGLWFGMDEYKNIDLSKPNYSRNNFYCFFSTIAANRDKKLEELGI